MNWKNVKLIFRREVRDQLRDRRTLFMIAVLPLLLYPLLGMSLFQVAQFVREQATRVLIIGATSLPAEPALVDDDHFDARWFSNPGKTNLLELHYSTDPTDNSSHSSKEAMEQARRLVESGQYAAVVFVPPDFAKRLDAFRARLTESGREAAAEKPHTRDATVPSPIVFYSTAKEKSQLAYLRVSQVIDRWMEEIGRENLETSRLPATAARPFDLSGHDVADVDQRHAAMWSKILPFMLLIWALTGAFYPAIDLCAGEKERGTLETLLSSPAERQDIVWGKLMTVMVFSMATAVLNLLSLGVTGSMVMSEFPELGAPPPWAGLWLAMALVPMSAFFSSLCLALAAMARSTKEGQYYLMQLILVMMPLMMLPMAPGVELTLGNSLIPVTGVVLLLRNMLEGNYLQAAPFIAPVGLMTIICCLLSARWAADQFNSESVLFRESERLDFGLRLKNLMRHRGDTPSAPAAVFCGVLILTVNFFMSFALRDKVAAQNPVVLALITQLVVIGTPALLMTIMLTRSPRKTLLLRLPPFGSIAAAVLLAVSVHPLVNALNVVVQQLYPVNESLEQMIKQLVEQSPSRAHLLLAIAVAPAIFEELAFRGFILSGLRHLGHKWRAIAVSSIFFGVAHGVFQQSIVASIVGLLIGYLAIQTGSLLPCIAYHFVHNSLALLTAEWTKTYATSHSVMRWLVSDGSHGFTFTWLAMIAGGIMAAGILLWFHTLPYRRSAEEVLQDAIEHQAVRTV